MISRAGISRWVVVIGLILGVAGLSACGDDRAEEERGEFRNPVGKADDTLSCKDHCGKKAPGGCWCDELCAQYGDCCTDKIDECDPKAQPTCKDSCGKKSPDGCWCDAACAKYGDCCPDKQQLCDAKPGCKANADCGANEYCHLDSGCLDGTVEGECKATPSYCPKGGTSVCGCDGKTYFNACSAHVAGTNVADPNNKCPADIHCGGIAGIPCPKGYKCWITASYPDASGSCVAEDFCNTVEDCKGLTPMVKCWGGWQCVAHKCQYKCGHTNPVCYVGGCNSELCTPVKDAVSPCVAKPFYSCLKHTQCGNFTADGECSWKPTTGYIDCMATFGQTVCDYDGDPDKTYLVKDPEQCKVVKFSCAPGKKPFFDACGCGCH